MITKPKRRPVFLALTLLVLFLDPHQLMAQSEVRTISKDDRVLAIYYDTPKKVSPDLIVAIWADGKAIWSRNRILGGAPYFSSTIPPKQVESVFSAISRNGYQDSPNLKVQRGFTSGQTSHLFIGAEGDTTEIVSCHDIYESGGDTFSSLNGLVPIKGESRVGLLQKESVENLHFRVCWLELKELIWSPIHQPEGTLVDVTLRYKDGAIQAEIKKSVKNKNKASGEQE